MMNLKTKKINKLLAVLVLVFLYPAFAFSQAEKLVPLHGHTVLQVSQPEYTYKTRAIITDTLPLPFNDDFSKPGPYPDTSRWLKSATVFINNNYPLNPKTLGVATFDGLNQYGNPYFPSISAGSGDSDTLSSKPLQMGGLTPADSVYLSFYFQCAGLGVDAPEAVDNLRLEFYNKATNNWDLQKVLSRPNNSTIYDAKFTRVMIPITAGQWFNNKFRFRFINKSTRCGAVDLWHLDNIYLNKNRTIYDTVLKDVAYTYSPGSLLKNYSAMPYNQYIGVLNMGSSTSLSIRNNDTTQGGINITGYLNVLNNTGNTVHSQTNGSGDILPYFPNGYCNIAGLASPAYASFAYNNGNSFTDTTSFLIKHYIKTSTFDANKYNDTVYRRQVFHNYFAYDDGTPEAAYQLNDFGAEMALRFDINVKDTMRALDICFDPIIYTNQIQTLTFGIYIWDNGGGIPGSVVYHDTLLNPKYSHNISYPFVRYMLKYGQVLNPGTYFIGIKQDDGQPLDVGFDRNTNSQPFVFYNVNGSWHNSSFQGTLMMRPVFGDSLKAIDGIVSMNNEKQTEISVYPNPASTNISIQVSGSLPGDVLQAECYDILGHRVFSQLLQEGQAVNISELNDGIYLLRVLRNNATSAYKKILISH